MPATPSRWCPWCGAALLAAAEDGAPLTCSTCGTSVPSDTALAVPRDQPLRLDDPDARLPPGVPEGAAPLPAGAPTMSKEALVRWAVILAVVVVSAGVLALAIGRPALRRLQPKPARPVATPPQTTPLPERSPAVSPVATPR